VIVWINGAYAVGKSTVAAELVRRQPKTTLLYEPEEIGYYLRDLVKPVEKARDYQELTLFTPVVIEVARQLHSYGRTLVMPLGVWHAERFTEIHNGLTQITQVKHYCLTATRATINTRLLYRGDRRQAITWIRERLDNCIEALDAPQFDKHITTNSLSPDNVAKQIIEDIEVHK
jgi:hypothetical protein